MRSLLWDRRPCWLRSGWIHAAREFGQGGGPRSDFVNRSGEVRKYLRLRRSGPSCLLLARLLVTGEMQAETDECSQHCVAAKAAPFHSSRSVVVARSKGITGVGATSNHFSCITSVPVRRVRSNSPT